MWKTRSFHTKFIELMQSHYLVPHHRNIAKRCISSWRKYARYRSSKDRIHERMSQVITSLTAKRYLRKWFAEATHDGGKSLRVRIMVSRLTTIVQNKRM